MRFFYKPGTEIIVPALIEYLFYKIPSDQKF